MSCNLQTKGGGEEKKIEENRQNRPFNRVIKKNTKNFDFVINKDAPAPPPLGVTLGDAHLVAPK